MAETTRPSSAGSRTRRRTRCCRRCGRIPTRTSSSASSRYTDEHGIDAVAELWSRASARSLPGALWRLYLLRLLIRQDPTGTSFLFQRGTEVSATIDPVVAGAPTPTGPDEIVALADDILRGIFAGDFGIALDRAAAFCRVMAAGATSVADDSDATEPERTTELTTRALRFAELADEFWRAHACGAGTRSTDAHRERPMGAPATPTTRR